MVTFARDNVQLLGILFFNTITILYARQIQTIYLPKTTPTPVKDENLGWGHAKNDIFMAFQWSKTQFFLCRLWITIHFLKGLCMN